MENPLISIIFPVYNAQETLRESIDSIISQSYSNWEMIIINDGSKDSSKEILLSYSDKRIKVYDNEINRGLIFTLNRGIELASGKYLARMDSDDIALPHRLEEQVSYMENHPKCIICGTYARSFSKTDQRGTLMKYEINHPCVANSLVLACCFAHPTVMIRSDVFSNTSYRYDEDYPYAEDYKLWIDLMHLGEYHNIPKVHLRYRVSDTQMSQSKDRNNDIVNNCRWLFLEKYLGKNYISEFKKGSITINTIKYLNTIDKDVKYIKQTFYLSLDKYSIKELTYFIISFDAFRFGFLFFCKFIKRMILGKAPIIYT